MKVKRIKDVKLPTRGTDKSAGIDFYIPNDFDFGFEIYPGESYNIPSGIKVEIPKGYVLIAFNKSGIAVKKHLQVGACVVDEDYQGEIHLHVINVGNSVKKLNPGEKIVQFILLPVNYCEIEESNEIHKTKTDRGSGGFGSTGLS